MSQERSEEETMPEMGAALPSGMGARDGSCSGSEKSSRQCSCVWPTAKDSDFHSE